MRILFPLLWLSQSVEPFAARRSRRMVADGRAGMGALLDRVRPCDLERDVLRPAHPSDAIGRARERGRRRGSPRPNRSFSVAARPPATSTRHMDRRRERDGISSSFLAAEPYRDAVSSGSKPDVSSSEAEETIDLRLAWMRYSEQRLGCRPLRVRRRAIDRQERLDGTR
jgi:hypothetical protein